MTSAMLSSKPNSYITDSFLGSGAFGEVVKCIRMEDMKTVAIKIQKLHGRQVNHIQNEMSTLNKLRELDPDKCNIVRFYENFIDHGWLYLVFEHLEKSLHHFVHERQSKRLILKEIRPIICQLATAFNHLSDLGLIHTDLKLENVMLVNHIQQPHRVKLIDFGEAIDVSAAIAGSTVQSMVYRSPEIILGLPFTEAIDMWSLGVMTATLFLGEHFYPSMIEYDTIRNIVESLGQPPDHMLWNGIKTQWYFKRDNHPASVWRLKTPNEYQADTGTMLTVTRTRVLGALDDVLHLQTVNHMDDVDNVAEMRDRTKLLQVLKKMLQLDPKERITPRQVLYEPFISMYHLVDLYLTSPHVDSCYDIMQAYQHYLDDDLADILYGSEEEPTSGPADTVQSTDLPRCSCIINEPH